MKTDSIKKRVYDIIDIGTKEDLLSTACDYILVIAIVLNLGALIAETFDGAAPYTDLLRMVEWVTLIVFIVEYLLRIWTAEYLYPSLGKNQAKLRYIFSFYGLIDLLSILPYFLLFLPSGFVAFRVLRVFRIFRLFKINAQYDAFNVVTDVIKSKKEQLFSSISLIFMMMLAASICMYGLEHEAQPDVFENAFSGMWWSVSSILTVGYGDIYPVTPVGRIMAIIISFLGVGLVAIPTGIISAGFVEQYQTAAAFRALDPDGDLDYAAFLLEEGHPWIGKDIFSIEQDGRTQIEAVLRGKHPLIPKETMRLKEGDLITVRRSR